MTNLTDVRELPKIASVLTKIDYRPELRMAWLYFDNTENFITAHLYDSKNDKPAENSYPNYEGNKKAGVKSFSKHNIETEVVVNEIFNTQNAKIYAESLTRQFEKILKNQKQLAGRENTKINISLEFSDAITGKMLPSNKESK